MKANSSTQTFSPEDSKRFAEENNKMIDIIKEMIENQDILFDVSFFPKFLPKSIIFIVLCRKMKLMQ